MRPLRSRAIAVLLTALFLGGAGGTADVDALLFHTGRTVVEPAGPRYEPVGAPHDHAAHCVLTLRVATAPRSPRTGRIVRYVGAPLVDPEPRSTAAPSRFFPGLHQDSRAPPAALA